MQYKFTYRQKNKGWQVILNYKRAGVWRQKSKQGFATKRAAQKYGAALLREAEKEKDLTPDRVLQGITFGAYVNLYCDTRAGEIKPSTLLNYRSLNRLFPGLVPMAMINITYVVIAGAINEIRPQFKRSTLAQIFIMLRTVFKAAVSQYHIISSNPTDGISIKPERANKKALTETQLKTLLAALAPQGNMIDCLIYLAIHTGARIGELRGICATDIGPDCIHIRRQYTITGRKSMAFTTVKNKGGVRSIPVPPKVLHTLRGYMAIRTTVPIDGRVFPATTGTGAMVNTRIQEILGKGYSVHTLRHTYATRLIAAGLDVKTVAALLGDTVATVLNNYTHYTDDMRQAAAEKIASIF